ncbi:hypothetical protein BDZ91DRAFT_721728 [Kalaharituber pfeilii]|nr:hypothetical protein BDZ91DRAFT_721728 [Kalaharituber pfeilii]
MNRKKKRGIVMFLTLSHIYIPGLFFSVYLSWSRVYVFSFFFGSLGVVVSLAFLSFI